MMEETCAGCGARLPRHDGPTHPYIGASSGCGSEYSRVLAHEYGPLGYPPVHRLTVDTYAAQHPGTPSRQAVQSVAVHLIGLHLWLERRLPATEITAQIGDAVRRGGFHWLEPPSDQGVRKAHQIDLSTDVEEHTRAIEGWAGSVWDAWHEHADTLRRWADRRG